MHTIIYHQYTDTVDCPDGLAAAWVANKKYPGSMIIGAQHGKPVDYEFEPNDSLLIVDFSFPKSTIDKWISSGVKVKIIDHHVTAWNDLNSLRNQMFKFHYDVNRSGAVLAWETLFPDEPIPVFLNYVQDRDLWNFKLTHTQAIHEAMGYLGRSFELYDKLEPLDSKEVIEWLVPIGEELLNEKRKKIKAALVKMKFQTVAGYANIPVVELNKEEDRLASDICSEMYRTYPQALFVACLKSDGKYTLRSDKNGNNTDVGKIAADNGGGGHRNAAGFDPNDVNFTLIESRLIRWLFC